MLVYPVGQFEVRKFYYMSSESCFRAVYRTIELSYGWFGKIIGTQVLFSAFLSQ